jgi:hypothetical protein
MVLTICIISVLLNIFFLLYARWLIKILRLREEEHKFVALSISDFVEHVDNVHELEMFYGDETLKSLMSHGKEIVSRLGEIEYLTHDLTTTIEEEDAKTD